MAERTQDPAAADVLRRDLSEAREHLAATSEVLAVLGRSGSDLDTVLGAVVANARSLCRADTALIYLLDGAQYRLARAAGMPEEFSRHISQHPITLDEGSLIGRVGLTHRALQIEDVLEDPSYGRGDAQRTAGYRTVMGAPMLLDDDVVGVLSMWRTEVNPFDDRSTTLLTAFAAHAAAAIRNAHLVRVLEQRTAELEVASRHKSEFLASMSHELRTPLNAVIGFSEVLLERMFGELNERQEEYLRDILDSGRHLLELLNDILDLSKVEAGAMELDRSEVDLARLIDDAVLMVRERAARGAVGLSAVGGVDVGVIHADPLRLKQVLLNLLTNAVKFTPPGGSVTVTAERSASAVVVSVSDTGTGIAREDHERIFESFQQGSRSPQRTEGTGLGLTLCRRIVELHGGEISMSSEVGRGSTFTVRLPSVLPAGADGVAGIHAGDGMAGNAGKEPVVLLVEDDQSSADLIVAYLEGSGYAVAVVADGAAALTAVARTEPVAVILDIQLPGVNGWAVLRAIKEDPRTADVPVVVTSVLDEKARGLSLGAAAYLVKPVSRIDLLATLDGLTPAYPTHPSRRR